ARGGRRRGHHRHRRRGGRRAHGVLHLLHLPGRRRGRRDGERPLAWLLRVSRNAHPRGLGRARVGDGVRHPPPLHPRLSRTRATNASIASATPPLRLRPTARQPQGSGASGFISTEPASGELTAPPSGETTPPSEASSRQLGLQPSPPRVFPSSQVSPASTTPLPQTGRPERGP